MHAMRKWFPGLCTSRQAVRCSFDLGTLSVTGVPVPVLDGVTQALYGVAGIMWTGAASSAFQRTALSSTGWLYRTPLLSFDLG
jgi:hypothetical protein